MVKNYCVNCEQGEREVRERRGEKGVGDENMSEQEGLVGGKREKANKERDTLMDRAIAGLTRNLALWKPPVIHRDNPI